MASPKTSSPAARQCGRAGGEVDNPTGGRVRVPAASLLA
jgi:hypothetical protein